MTSGQSLCQLLPKSSPGVGEREAHLLLELLCSPWKPAALVAEITIEKRPQPTIPVAVMGARVGDNHEDAGGTQWSAEPPQG
jgi:hypothetical protein